MSVSTLRRLPILDASTPSSVDRDPHITELSDGGLNEWCYYQNILQEYLERPLAYRPQSPKTGD